jgi:lysophospholipase L1-like esterase
MNPTLVLIELGYFDAIEAAVTGDPERMATVDEFRANYRQIVERISENAATIILTTVPDPTRTAYFSSIGEAASRLQQTEGFFEASYGFAPDDLLAESAIRDISTQILVGRTAPLKPEQVLSAANAASIRERVRAWNAVIVSLGGEYGAVVYDLAVLFERIRSQGVEVAGRALTGTAFGGFYGLDWLHPGATGHAIIANEISELLNSSFQAGLPATDLDEVAREDPVFHYRPLGGGP